MAKYMGNAVKTAFERDVINGDAKSQTAFFPYGLTSIGISFLEDKGISKISHIWKNSNAGKLTEDAVKLNCIQFPPLPLPLPQVLTNHEESMLYGY